MNKALAALIALGGICWGSAVWAQDEEDIPVDPQPTRRSGDRRGPGERGGQGGRGGEGRPNMMRMFPMFAAIDEDEDGEISAKELRRAITALKTLDQNEDGKLTDDEVRPQFPGGGPGGPGGGPGGAGGPGGDGGAGGAGGGGPGGSYTRGGQRQFGPPDPASMVKRWMEFDADKDGKLSQEELTAMAQQFGRPPQRQRPGENGQGGPPPTRQQPVDEIE